MSWRLSSDRANWAILGLFTLAFFLGTFRLAGQNLFNAYPFMSSDSFDYVFQGFALWARLQGYGIDELPVLRNPGYVLVHFLDHLVGKPGLVLFGITALALAGMGASLLVLARILQVPAGIARIVLVSLLFCPLGVYWIRILSEALSLGWMSVSLVALAAHARGGGRPWCLLLAGVAAWFGAMTQMYVAIPFLIYNTVTLLPGLRVQRWYFPVAANLIFALLVVGATGWWRSAFQYDMVPRTFALLEPSLPSFGFRVQVWAYLFLPLVPLLALGIRRPAGLPGSFRRDPFAVCLTLTMVGMLTLECAYRDKDPRFSLIHQPVLHMLLLVMLARSFGGDWESLKTTRWRRVVVLAGLLVVGRSFVFSSRDLQIGRATIEPKGTWAYQLGRGRLQDRWQLESHCRGMQFICPEAPLPDGLTRYRTTIFTEYQALQGRVFGGQD